MNEKKRVIIGVTGASGSIYAYKLLSTLKDRVETDLIISETARIVIKEEMGVSYKQFYSLASKHYEDNQLNVPIASGSNKIDTMIIVPASMSTISKISVGIEDTLITRAAAVCIKENKKLVIVPRETPVSAIHLDNMSRLAYLGVKILLASPPFYTQPKTIEDMVNYIVGKILDSIGVEHNLYKPYKVGISKSSSNKE
ncbi:MAG: UbiX family flavin prenyltransferase [Thermoplasmata archaeon]